MWVMFVWLCQLNWALFMLFLLHSCSFFIGFSSSKNSNTMFAERFCDYHCLILMFSICFCSFNSSLWPPNVCCIRVQCASMHLCIIWMGFKNRPKGKTMQWQKRSALANTRRRRRQQPETALIANLGAARILFLCVAFWLHNLFKNQYEVEKKKN